MHYKKSAILIIVIISLLFAPAVQAEEAFITTDNLNVREGPGTNFNRIDQVNTGDRFPIRSQSEAWIEIEIDDGRSGWVSSEFVTIDNVADNDAVSTSEKTITIKHKNTHLRKGPSSTYDIAGYANAGEKFDVINENEDWLEVTNEEQSGFLFKGLIESQSQSNTPGIENKTIVIDPGHGGVDVGAIGASGTYEKQFTKRTVQELEKELTVLGADVVLTRHSDHYISLASRISLSNITAADAFISVHYNSFPEAPDVTGVTTYYSHERDQGLASKIQQALISQTSAEDRHIKHEDYYVISRNMQPSVLVELGFISNAKQEELFQTNSYQKKLVSSIIKGLNNYFSGQ
ncbi:N-acetylmuramoyl-L-alanine amidase [Lentibacillus persicus]|uniref:N-acetylmuramoyl-L-alanine amidase n=1 Tax=Lentibacillus persicus TaxID=640948 RepID=A0A1I1TJ70_9BACI|nr:N-acetylmuramoyl-L-alanine amidase [Lentibacillus persicus]SFD57208.1 N-acetylmuramoyl-L-alanine amidase [Lentibacillus persicus]